jgi:acetyltransferase-like isoleucine patch superfamily enzyme
MNYFIHPAAICEADEIGDNTRIWAFAHILQNAKVGSDCNICDHVFIENDVRIGNRVTIKCGVQIWDGITVEDDVFIGPNATFTNDLFPRSKQYPASFSRTLIRRGASIGANATLLPGITIGIYAMVGAGAVVTRNVPPYAKVVGNPAYIVGYADEQKVHSVVGAENLNVKTLGHSSVFVRGVGIYELPLIRDLRGNLSVGEFERSIPFFPKRYFLVNNVPNKKVRGEHAHKQCEQFLICIQGSCTLLVDDGVNRLEILLDRINKGVYIPPMIWGVQYKYSVDSVLLVFASDYYDDSDYIRDYDQFLEMIQ